MHLSSEDVIRAKRQLLEMQYRNRIGHLRGNLSALYGIKRRSLRLTNVYGSGMRIASSKSARR
jgi:hypothetical protein